MEKDLFSEQAGAYARFRPGYPPELFNYILSFVADRNSAWDAGTGNGQAALSLSHFFKHVTGSDISAQQLANAGKADNVTYLVANASLTPLPDQSVDLVTVAQAYHWFDFNAFAKEVDRVGKPGVIVAVWCYTVPILDDIEVNNVLIHFYKNVVGPYWDPERRYIDELYMTIPFPFEPLPGQQFASHYYWTKEQLIGFLSSWSAVQHYIHAEGVNPLVAFENSVAAIWPAGKLIAVEFPIYLLLGRKRLSSGLSKNA